MTSFVIEKSTDEESNLVDKGINEYNSSNVLFTQEPNFVSIDRVIKGLNGEMLAGINSELYCWNCLYIQVLWVTEEFRQNGYGSALLNEVEKIAKGEG